MYRHEYVEFYGVERAISCRYYRRRSMAGVRIDARFPELWVWTLIKKSYVSPTFLVFFQDFVGQR